LVVSSGVAALQLDSLFDRGLQKAVWVSTGITQGIPFGHHGAEIFEPRYSHSMLPLSNTSLIVLGGTLQDGSLDNGIWLCTLSQYIPTPTSDSSNDQMSTYLLMGTVGVGCLILAIVFYTWIVRHRTQKRSQENLQRLMAGVDAHDETHSKDSAGPQTRGVTWEAVFSHELQDAPDFIIDFSALRIVKQIGHGSTCVVHVAWWAKSKYDAPRPVAVKRFFLESSFKREDFFRETLIHRKLKHANVLELHAVTADPPCSVTELMWQGSLYHILQSEREVPFPMALQFAIDAAEGMRYLHACKPVVLHRDLKTLNLLVNDEGRVKVCDFGISRLKASVMTTGAGSIQYMAPEVFTLGHYSEKSDIYSFAIVLWELITRETPYTDAPTVFMVMSAVKSGERLPIPEKVSVATALSPARQRKAAQQAVPQAYRGLIEKCWAHDTQLRPCFKEILTQLRLLEQEHPFTEEDRLNARQMVAAHLQMAQEEALGNESSPELSPLLAQNPLDAPSPTRDKQPHDPLNLLTKSFGTGQPNPHTGSLAPRESEISSDLDLQSSLSFGNFGESP